MIQTVKPGVYAITLGFVNAFLIEQDGLTLIDTGINGSSQKILEAVSELGKKPSEIRRILLTHLHGDHIGGLAELKRQTGAPAFMHPLDAALARKGQTGRPVQPGPGLFNQILIPLVIRLRGMPDAAPLDIEYDLEDGQEIEGTGGLTAVHTPGHTAGHVVFIWPQQGGVLFVGDAASHLRGLSYSMLYEDQDEGKRSLKKIAGLEFETACFSHGKLLSGGAAAAFREKWG